MPRLLRSLRTVAPLTDESIRVAVADESGLCGRDLVGPRRGLRRNCCNKHTVRIPLRGRVVVQRGHQRLGGGPRGEHDIFFGCSDFNQGIGGWDVGNVIGMTSMFHGASSFDQYIGNWDTFALRATDEMFTVVNALSFIQAG